MRKYFAVMPLLFLSALLLFSGCARKSRNLIPEGSSFEVGLDGMDYQQLNRMVDGWGVTPGDAWRSMYRDGSYRFYAPEFYPNTAVDGHRSMRVEFIRGMRGELRTTWFPVVRSGRHTLSFYARSDSPGTVISASIFAAGTRKRSKTFHFRPNAGWRRFTCTMVPPQSLEHLCSIRFIFKAGKQAPSRSSYRVWIDAIQLESGDRVTPYVPGDALAFKATAEKPGALYDRHDVIRLKVDLCNRTASRRRLKVRYRIIDINEAILQQGTFPLSVDKGETITHRLRVTGKKLGAFKAEFELRGAGRLLQTDEVVFGRIIANHDLRKNPSSRFGSHILTEYPATKMLKADVENLVLRRPALCGVKWTRMFGPFYWPTLEPEQGRFGNIDYMLNFAARYGYNILGVVHGCPDWAVKERGRLFRRQGVNLGKTELWAKYVHTIVSKYKSRIRHWEIWNEPCCAMSVEQYFQVLKTAYKAAKKADPQCVIVGSGGNGTEWLEKLFKLGGLEYMDVVSQHYYTIPRNTPFEGHKRESRRGNLLERIPHEKALIRKYNHGRDKPLWNSETGWPLVSWHDKVRLPKRFFAAQDHVSRTELVRRRANYLIRHHVVAFASGVDRYFQFYFENTDNIAKSNLFYMTEHDFAPTAAMTAYAAMTRLLDGAEFLRRITLGMYDGCYLVRLKNGRECYIIYNWYEQGTPQARIKLPAGTTVMDIMGNECSFPVQPDGFTKIPIRNLFYVCSGITGHDAELARAVAECTTSGYPAIKVYGARLIADPAGHPVLAVRLQNAFRKSLSGWSQIQGEDEVGFKVAGSGGITDVMLPLAGLDSSAHKREFRILVWRADDPGIKSTHVIKADYLYCNKRTHPVKLDGRLDDWPEAPDMRLDTNAISGLRIDRWQGPQDCSCHAWMNWDDANLYFAFKVKDDAIVQSHELRVYEEDCVEIFIDTDLAGDFYVDNANNDDVQLGITPITREQPGGKVVSFAQGKRLVDQNLVSAVSRNTGDGYVIEVKLSWSALGVSPGRIPPAVGFTFAVDDADRKGVRKSQIIFCGCRRNNDTVSGYATVFLCAE